MGLASWECPKGIRLFYYIDDIMLTSDSLTDLEGVVPLLQRLAAWGWVVNEYKV